MPAATCRTQPEEIERFVADFDAENSSKKGCTIYQNWGLGTSFWRVGEFFWSHCGGLAWVLAPECVLGGVLGRLGGVLDTSWKPLGPSWAEKVANIAPSWLPKRSQQGWVHKIPRPFRVQLAPDWDQHEDEYYELARRIHNTILQRQTIKYASDGNFTEAFKIWFHIGEQFLLNWIPDTDFEKCGQCGRGDGPHFVYQHLIGSSVPDAPLQGYGSITQQTAANLKRRARQYAHRLANQEKRKSKRVQISQTDLDQTHQLWQYTTHNGSFIHKDEKFWDEWKKRPATTEMADKFHQIAEAHARKNYDKDRSGRRNAKADTRQQDWKGDRSLIF